MNYLPLDYLEVRETEPQSLENLVVDYAIDGGDVPDLSFDQIKDLRRDIGSYATELCEIGLDADGVLRLYQLGVEYSIYKNPRKQNFIGVNSDRTPQVTDQELRDAKKRLAEEKIQKRVYRPGYGATAPQALAGCAKELRGLQEARVFDPEPVQERYGIIEPIKNDEGEIDEGKDINICASCPVIKELGECDIRDRFKRLSANQVRMIREARANYSGSVGQRSLGAFSKVQSDYNGQLGGGTPRDALKVPGIVHI